MYGCATELSRKGPGKVANAHGQPRSQLSDPQRFTKIFDDPNGQFAERNLRGLLKSEGGAELTLATRSSHEEHHRTGHSKGNIYSKVFLDKRQAKVYSCSYARRGYKFPIPNKDGIGIYSHFRIIFLKFSGETPVGGRPTAIEKPRLREDEGSRTHGT